MIEQCREDEPITIEEVVQIVKEEENNVVERMEEILSINIGQKPIDLEGIPIF